MKISDTTLSILKNFTTINNSIMFREGNILTTMEPHKQIVAKAILQDSFPMDFAIYDLSQFLSVLSLFKKDFELDFGQRQVTISSGTHKVFYTYAEPTMIKAPPKEFNLGVPDDAVSFSLSAAHYSTLVDAMSVLGLEKIAIIGDGLDVTIGTFGPEASASSYKLTVGSSDHIFKIILTGSSLRMLAKDYTVSVCDNLTQFETQDLTYWVVNESDSKF